MSKTWTRLIALVTVFCMLFSAEVFAGKGYDQSSGGKKKVGFFCKVGKAIKKATQKAAKAIKTAAQKTGKAIKTAAKKTGQAIKNAAIKTGKAIKVAGAKINNAVKDSGVWMKKKVFGCKNRVWVVGHYDKNGKWIKGHWRKLESKPGNNHPGQGNNPGQANNPGQTEDPLPPVGGEPGVPGGDAGQTPSEPAPIPGNDEPAPMPGSEEPAPAPAPADPVLPELPEGDDPAPIPAPGTEQPGDETEQPGDEQPAPEQPAPEQPAPEQPGDEAGQAGQGSQTEQSEEAGQAGQAGQASQGAPMKEEAEISLRTMGMLMNDIVKQSGEITTFKKAAAPGMNYSMDVQSNVNSTYESREANAKLLVKVIVWDLQQNKGNPGQYFSYFTFKMKDLDPESRKLIRDVTRRVQEGVKYGAGHVTEQSEKAVFEKRLEEIEGF